MPNWTDVLREIQVCSIHPDPAAKVRSKYIKQLSQYRKRNVIVYYSGWIQRNNTAVPFQINDEDMNSFMTMINGMDTSKGLDLLLHTPGGDPTATEAIVNYLFKKFKDNISCFVPQLAMSAGTMIACSCKEIYMGKQSSIGPIDPQMGPLPAYAILEEFKKAVSDIKSEQATIPLWGGIFRQIHPGLLTECQQAVDLSTELVKEWLKRGMFKNNRLAGKKATRVTNYLNSHKKTKLHSRHIDSEQAKAIGLCINDLEADQQLQDLVLTVHHACMHSFSQIPSLCKIVENQNACGICTHFAQAQ